MSDIEAMPEVDESLLPQVARDLASCIGIQAVLLLIAKYGGTRLYVPLDPKENHPIEQLIGSHSLMKLAQRYGGDTLEIPRALIANISARNVQIKQEYHILSQSQLARKYGMTERQIRNIVTKDMDEQQPKLFE